MPRPAGRSLQGDDAKVLMAWLDELLARHRTSDIMNLVPPGFFHDRLQQTTDPQRRRATLLFTLSRRMGESGEPLDFPTEDDYQTLAQKLSRSPRQELEALATRKEKGERVFESARSQYMSQFQPQQPSREELDKYFRDEISPNDRAWLEGLPPERFARELRRQTQMQQMRRAAFDPQRSSPGKPVIPGAKGRPRQRPWRHHLALNGTMGLIRPVLMSRLHTRCCRRGFACRHGCRRGIFGGMAQVSKGCGTHEPDAVDLCHSKLPTRVDFSQRPWDTCVMPPNPEATAESFLLRPAFLFGNHEFSAKAID